MDGKFYKQKFTSLFNVLGLISGIILVILFGFFLVIGEFSTLDDQIASWFFVGFGIFTIALCSVSLYVNKKAFIHVNEQGISAFCHFGLSLECSLMDIRHVSFGGDNLGIQLKSGKKFNIMHLENAHHLCRYIQRRIPGSSFTSLGRQEFLDILISLQKKRNRKAIASICCFLLLFPSIFATVAFTGGKDLQDFATQDWHIFAVMACIGALITAASIILLRQYLLQDEKLHKLKGAFYQTILRTSPIPSGNPIKMYLDNEHDTSIRLVVLGFPNSDEVYFTIEQVNPSYEIERIHTSGIYPSFRKLGLEIEDRIEVPLP